MFRRCGLFVVCALVSCLQSLEATLIVHDPGGWISYQTANGFNFSQYVTQTGYQAAIYGKQLVQLAHEINTDANTLNTYYSELVNLARMGDPKTLANLLGVSDILSLYTDYVDIYNTVNNIRMLASPQRFEQDLNSILSYYQHPNWSGVIAYAGTAFVPSAGNYQYANSTFNAVQTAQQQIDQLNNQKQVLQTRRDGILQSLQAAPTQSEVQKWQGALTGINAAMQQLDNQIAQIKNQTDLTKTQNDAAQQVYNATVKEQAAASMLEGVESDFSSFNGVTNNYLQPFYWGGGGSFSSSPGNTSPSVFTNLAVGSPIN